MLAASRQRLQPINSHPKAPADGLRQAARTPSPNVAGYHLGWMGRTGDYNALLAVQAGGVLRVRAERPQLVHRIEEGSCTLTAIVNRADYAHSADEMKDVYRTIWKRD